jgi:hypothetical protein
MNPISPTDADDRFIRKWISNLIEEMFHNSGSRSHTACLIDFANLTRRPILKERDMICHFSRKLLPTVILMAIERDCGMMRMRATEKVSVRAGLPHRNRAKIC